eukprot:scaffold1744_cov340-Prasinococcus_capsulatus_cf.AAC.28
MGGCPGRATHQGLAAGGTGRGARPALPGRGPWSAAARSARTYHTTPRGPSRRRPRSSPGASPPRWFSILRSARRRISRGPPRARQDPCPPLPGPGRARRGGPRPLPEDPPPPAARPKSAPSPAPEAAVRPALSPHVHERGRGGGWAACGEGPERSPCPGEAPEGLLPAPPGFEGAPG